MVGCEETALENWIPIKFEPDVEREYAMHMLERFIPLARLGSIFGIMAFVGYFFGTFGWTLLLSAKQAPFV